MKKEELYAAIGDIDDGYVNEARLSKKNARPVWIKWVAVAACLCLVVMAAFAIPGMLQSFGPEGRPDGVYAYTVSYAGWSDDPSIADGALNRELLQDETLARLPVFKLDTLEELEQFQAKYEAVFSMEQGFNNVLSFEGALKKAQWDREAFFEEHSLMVVYVPANSGSFRFGIRDVNKADISITVCVEQKNDPETVTEDMAGWFILLEVEDEEIRNYTSFDAMLATE